MSAVAHSSDLRLYRRLLIEARPYWWHIAGLLAVSVLSTPLALLAPLPLKIVVDSALGDHPLPGVLGALVPATSPPSSTGTVLLAVALLLLITLVSYLRGFANTLLDTYTGERLVLGFRARLFEQVQRLSFSYHDGKGVSDSLYRIQYDAPAIQWVAVQGVIPFVTAGLTLVGMIYVIARIDRDLAIVALAVSPALFLLTRMFRRPMRAQWTRIKGAESSAMAAV